MKNSLALRLAIALYPASFRHRFAAEILTTMSDLGNTPAEGTLDIVDTSEAFPEPEADYESSRSGAPAQPRMPNASDFRMHGSAKPNFRDVLNLAQHGLRARFRATVMPTNSPSLKLQRLSTWLLLAGTLAMAYKLGAFSTPNDIDRQHATARGQSFHGSLANNLKLWRYEVGDLLRNNTPTGGDMGSHVWAADALRRDVLPQWRLTGWSNDWYAGMPLLSFYFPLPMLGIVALSTILPFGIAFKIVTALGSIALPFVTRKATLRFGMPMSAATLSALGTFAVLFGRFYDWTGYGGTLFSTMSGEFSFSLSSCLAVAFLGSFAMLLRTGAGRGRTAFLLAGAGLCHLLPTMWAIIGALIIFCLHLEKGRIRRQLIDSSIVALLGAGLAGFWLLPFAANLDYTNSMGWERKTNFIDSLFPFVMTKPLADSTVVLIATLCCSFALLYSLVSVTKGLLIAQSTRSRILSGIGTGCAVFAGMLWWGPARGVVIVVGFGAWVGLGTVASLRRVSFDRPTYALSLLLAACGIVFVQAPEFRLWNARVLPFWFLTLFLLTGMGCVHIVRLAGTFAQWLARGHLRTLGIDSRLGLAIGAAVVFVAVGLPVGLAPASMPIPKYTNGLIGVQRAGSSTDRSNAPGWTSHNYRGYEGLPAWPEYKGIMDTATAIGRKTGCGRAMWEYEHKTLEAYGTTLALTLLPYWTKGCIGSLEGVYYESSATAPVHFRNASLVNAPQNEGLNGEQKVSGLSNPQRNVLYPPFDLEAGIDQLRIMGVRYYMAVTQVAVAAAAQSRQLIEVGVSPAFDPVTKAPRSQWHFYEIINNALVAPIEERPVVIKGIGQAQDEGWLDTSMASLDNHLAFPKTLVTNGPKDWERADVTIVKRPIDRTYGTGVHLSGASVRSALPTLRACWKRQALESVAAVSETSGPPSSISIASSLSRGSSSISASTGAQGAGNASAQSRAAKSKLLSPANEAAVRDACTTPSTKPVALSAVQPSLPTTTISNIRQTRNSISFRTSTPGVPVVVRLSYFPNWKAKGAQGPFRTMPNFMTVIPTTGNVTLTYGRRPVDVLGELATAASFALLLGGRWRRRRRPSVYAAW